MEMSSKTGPWGGGRVTGMLVLTSRRCRTHRSVTRLSPRVTARTNGEAAESFQWLC
jgi:hypothetical protein